MGREDAMRRGGAEQECFGHGAECVLSSSRLRKPYPVLDCARTYAVARYFDTVMHQHAPPYHTRARAHTQRPHTRARARHARRRRRVHYHHHRGKLPLLAEGTLARSVPAGLMLRPGAPLAFPWAGAVSAAQVAGCKGGASAASPAPGAQAPPSAPADRGGHPWGTRRRPGLPGGAGPPAASERAPQVDSESSDLRPLLPGCQPEPREGPCPTYVRCSLDNNRDTRAEPSKAAR